MKSNEAGTAVPDPCEKPTLTMKEAAELLGVGVKVAYDAANRTLEGLPGGIPCIRVGERRLVIPTRPLLDLLGLTPGAPN